MTIRPDAATLMLVAALITPLIAAAVLFHWRQTREPALAWWAGGTFAMAAGALCALGGTIPSLSPLLDRLGSAFLILGHGLFLIGIGAFFAGGIMPLPWRQRVAIAGVAGVALLAVSIPSALTHAIGNLINAAIALTCAYFLIARRPSEARASAGFTGAIFLLDALIQLLSGAMLIANPERTFSAALLDAASFVLLVGWNFGFLMLIGQRNQERVIALANRDELTGARTRRALFDTGRQLFALSAREAGALSVLIMDIDHFKQINDRHGHAGGDAVLRRFAEVVRNGLRDADLFGRIGGEEFCVLLPGSELEGARRVAERVRADFAAQVVTIGPTSIGATVSIGIARRDAGTRDLDGLIARADEALYQAKRDGRNRVAVASAGDAAPPQVVMSWDGRYRSGHPLIDEEHQRLLIWANALINQLRINAANTAIIDDLSELLFWLGEHFRHEETILAEQGWADLPTHVTQHRMLEQRGSLLLNDVIQGRRNSEALLDFVVMDVIGRHLAMCDTQYFPVLGPEPPAAT